MKSPRCYTIDILRAESIEGIQKQIDTELQESGSHLAGIVAFVTRGICPTETERVKMKSLFAPEAQSSILIRTEIHDNKT